jgi:hypothetical protein
MGPSLRWGDALVIGYRYSVTTFDGRFTTFWLPT